MKYAVIKYIKAAWANLQGNLIFVVLKKKNIYLQGRRFSTKYNVIADRHSYIFKKTWYGSNVTKQIKSGLPKSHLTVIAIRTTSAIYLVACQYWLVAKKEPQYRGIR
jgi:hypothetical protein